ncbi:CBS domain-containing protein [Clostridium niameyense]|uniref:CBS domain-containing protein n=1 Tax=Clostridium niameyense TaxID=1622073 RepID=A0A6M0RBL0_9CLOT|nr:CBS domain-containing protein [Clostridium niameyense]NEZ46949.1 CBS domain-containing protein [Clostridium niameyense]
MIGDIMKKHVITLEGKDNIRKALNLMSQTKINGAPVVDSEGKLSGMIVKADIYRFLMEEGHYDTCPVDWVMSKEVITAKEKEHIIDVAGRLLQNDIVAIPVIDDKNKIQGIVCIEDILMYCIEKLNKCKKL